MKRNFRRLVRNRNLTCAAKIIACLVVFACVLSTFFTQHSGPETSYVDSVLRNDFDLQSAAPVTVASGLEQGFTAQGDILSNLSLYFCELPAEDGKLMVEVLDTTGNVLLSKAVQLSDYAAGSWNTIDLSLDGLETGHEYLLRLFAEDEGVTTYIDTARVSDGQFTACVLGGNEVSGTAAVGFQFTQRYTGQTNVVQYCVELAWVLLLTGTLCVAIWKIEQLAASCKSAAGGRGVLYALYFAVSLLLQFNPLSPARTGIEEFDRTFGISTLMNYDVGKVISNFTNWFVCLAVFFCLFYLLINDWRQREKDSNRLAVWAFLDNAIVLASVSLLFDCITFFSNESSGKDVFGYSSGLLALILVCGFLYLALRLNHKISAKHYLQVMLSAYAISFPLAVVCSYGWSSGNLLLDMHIVVAGIVIVLLKCFGPRLNSNHMGPVLDGGVSVLCLLPFVTSLYIEAVNILNQYSIFVVRLRLYYLIVVCAVLGAVVLVAWVLRRKNRHLKNWKSWVYIWLVFGIACLSAQIPLQSVYSADIFESANYSVLISDFLNFGSIPLVEHYGGHMLEMVLEGIIYGVLNQDYTGAIFSPYAGYFITVLSVLFYYLAKHIWDEDMAVWTALLFPFYSQWYYFGLGMLVGLALIGYARKNTYPRAFLFWLAFIFCALYRLDLGFSFGIAGIAALAVYTAVSRNKKAVKQLLVSLAWIGVFGVGLWCGLCIWKNIDSISRLKEFLFISQSNPTWAFSTIGDDTMMLYPWCYLLLPFITVLCLLYAGFSRKFREKIAVEKWMLLLLLGIAYLTNFSRGLVRHSLAEMTTYVVLWSAYVFLAAFISCARGNGKLFIPVFAGLLLMNSLMTHNGIFAADTVADTAALRLGSQVETWTARNYASAEGTQITYWEAVQQGQEPVERVLWSDDVEQTAGCYGTLMDALLEEDETFLDFMNRSFLYSALGRKNPVYVSQSPLQLSGEYTQEMFVAEIESNLEKIPLVLMPLNDTWVSYSLDGVANTYRYYEVSEFIYTHYEPLCSFGEFALWCLPERRAEMESKLEQAELIDAFIECQTIAMNNCQIAVDASGKSVTIIGGEIDPYLYELQNFIDLSQYDGMYVRLTVEYESSVEGLMQFMYTTEKGETYSADKVVDVQIGLAGTAEFVFPAAEYGRLRLDTPDNSVVKITSIQIGLPVDSVDWGYDALDELASQPMESYNNLMHNYKLYQLPRIWAEYDEQGAVNNNVVARAEKSGEYYLFDSSVIQKDETGNYLHLAANYLGTDVYGAYGASDETVDAVIKLGVYENGELTIKYRYHITLTEGMHDYLIRISSDYFWYSEEINAVWIDCAAPLCGITVDILQGD